MARIAAAPTRSLRSNKRAWNAPRPESLVRLTAEHVDNELRLGRTLESKATAGEGVQNLIRAAQALAALIVLIGASSGLGIIDPLALC